ncbi:carbamoyltransferase HypF [Anaerotignum neopropionicum]|uniref:Carbamoyltransferase n=1 Tax=Anaerotignum neopropionicum TaxID=36847 RepID=A0A136WD54_9FIRM|nr:carbamoyltransferase HypF [Anaerotignum neopropionicum]KXL52438.1 carbamoyltransferase HypF [Anaerotignum neopropionicum]
MSNFLSYLIHIRGIVQGVGMRPYIYKTAKAFRLTGFVKNKGSSVEIVISGEQWAIDGFLYELTSNPPPNATIYDISVTPHTKAHFRDFKILHSSQNQQMQDSILPDLAVCEECMEDIRNRQDRRFEYAFTNCTNCGPRYSILKDLPYDRENTSMHCFSMCPQCREEYKNPQDRRFHAQPNCCPVCGPKYSLGNCMGEPMECESPVEKTKQLLKEGKIIAIKGIGGYHLVCNAQDEAAIATLRTRKKRPHKPFAIMAAVVEDVLEICTVSPKEKETLANNQRPIVLLNKKGNALLPEIIAPRLHQYGVMLPYTPLHYFLFEDSLKYLIMTSGNISGMSICYKDEDALTQLSEVADYFLIHNREIMTPIDDSVIRVLGEDVLISRCGRGYAPMSLPLDTPFEILALGGNQKASVCFLHHKRAHISQYLGELNFLDACNEYISVINRLGCLLNANPKFFAHDLHPNFFSTQYGKTLGKKSIAVQHHHAHMAGCMAEHEFCGVGIGIIFDGTGMGTDGTIWGGEFLVGSRGEFKRVGHLECVTLQGADSAIEAPWKCALSYLHTMNENIELYLPNIDKQQLQVIKKALQNNVNCYQSSSMGRFFDCVAALTLHRSQISYEAQAAIELESMVDAAITEEYDFSISETEGGFILRYQSILKGVLEDLKNQQPVSVISAKFHNTISRATVVCACHIREKFNLNSIFLSGGVFENSYLLKNIVFGLTRSDFQVFYNRKVPLNDGGLCFGQGAAAASILEGGAYVPSNSYEDYFRTGQLCLCRNHGNSAKN